MTLALVIYTLIYTLIYTINGESLGLIFTESSKILDMTSAAGTAAFAFNVAYDEVRGRYVYTNQFVADDANKPPLNSIEADFAANASITDPGFVGPKIGRKTIMQYLDGKVINYGGADIANDIMYVVAFYGYLLAIDLDSKDVINYIEFGTFPNGYTGGCNSVCIDSENTTMAYVPAINGDIYAVNIGTDTVEGWTKNKIYTAGDAIQDGDGANPRTDFRAFDCTVYNGYVYFIEFSLVQPALTTGNLGIYDIDKGTFSYSTSLSVPARSITELDGVLIVANNADSKTYVSSTIIPDDTTEAIMSFQNVATFDIAIIWQITADYDNGIIVLSCYDGNGGFLYFVNTVPITAQPTTAEPTTAIPTTAIPTTAIPTTAIPTTAIPTTATPTTAEPTVVTVADRGDRNFHHSAFIVMFLIISNIFLLN